MGLTDPIVWLLALVSLISSIVSATFGLGGGFIILAVLGLTLPVNAMVPLHSALALGLLVSRSWYYRHDISWDIVRSFLPGAVIGVLIGARLYVELPEVLIAAMVSILMLVALWFPSVNWRPSFAHPFFYVGIIHSLLSTLFSFGGVFQPLMIRTRLNKFQIIGTIAFALLVMMIMKIAGYIAFGFDYRPYITIIIVVILASFPGAAIVKCIVSRFNESNSVWCSKYFCRHWLCG